MTHGAEQAVESAPDPTLEARWSEFNQRAFVMLGPARFDEIQAVSGLLQRGEITQKEMVARTKYVMGREFEGLHDEYLKIMRKLGYKEARVEDR